MDRCGNFLFLEVCSYVLRVCQNVESRIWMLISFINSLCIKVGIGLRKSLTFCSVSRYFLTLYPRWSLPFYLTPDSLSPTGSSTKLEKYVSRQKLSRRGICEDSGGEVEKTCFRIVPRVLDVTLCRSGYDYLRYTTTWSLFGPCSSQFLTSLIPELSGVVVSTEVSVRLHLLEPELVLKETGTC